MASVQHNIRWVQHTVVCLCVCVRIGLAGGSAQVGLMLTSTSLSIQH